MQSACVGYEEIPGSRKRRLRLEDEGHAPRGSITHTLTLPTPQVCHVFLREEGGVSSGSSQTMRSLFFRSEEFAFILELYPLSMRRAGATMSTVSSV